MENTGLILDELKADTPILASLCQSDVYTVPNGYFEHLATDITAEINGKMLFSTQPSNVLQIPEGYFETLADAVISRIQTEKSEVFVELESIAPLLNTISKKNIFNIPVGYFENFAVAKYMLESAKIISFSKTRKWISYAAAAVIAGVLFTGGFLYNYQRTSLDVSKELNKVSDSELNAYVENGNIELNEDNYTLDKDIFNLKETLTVISDEDLHEYLKDAEQ